MKNSPEDDWTRALKGDESVGNTHDGIEGAVIRKAMLQRRKELNQMSKEFNPTEFKKIKSKLIKLGLLKPNQRPRIIALSFAFFAGIASTLTSLSLFFAFALQPTLQGVRGDDGPPRIGTWVSKFMYSDENDDLEKIIKNKEIPEINIKDTEVLKIATFIESEARIHRLQTKIIPFETGVTIYLKNLNSDGEHLNELRLLLGLNPEFSGPVKIVIQQPE
jgi:hypothetical protein